VAGAPVLAYISWHRPVPTVESSAYERALEQFHRSLAHRPPCGFQGSAAFRAPELPWLAAAGEVAAGGEVEGGHGASGEGYEDWYLLEDWAAVGVLEEAAVSHGHASLHEHVASRAGVSSGAVYRLIEGHAAQLADARVAVWVTRSPGRERPSLEALLGDGMDPASGCVWRRCLGLGPAPEYCVLAAEASAGVAAERLPKGWQARTYAREALWDD
jgi:hypothetical protein